MTDKIVILVILFLAVLVAFWPNSKKKKGKKNKNKKGRLQPSIKSTAKEDPTIAKIPAGRAEDIRSILASITALEFLKLKLRHLAANANTPRGMGRDATLLFAQVDVLIDFLSGNIAPEKVVYIPRLIKILEARPGLWSTLLEKAREDQEEATAKKEGATGGPKPVRIVDDKVFCGGCGGELECANDSILSPQDLGPDDENLPPILEIPEWMMRDRSADTAIANNDSFQQLLDDMGAACSWTIANILRRSDLPRPTKDNVDTVVRKLIDLSQQASRNSDENKRNIAIRGGVNYLEKLKEVVGKILQQLREKAEDNVGELLQESADEQSAGTDGPSPATRLAMITGDATFCECGHPMVDNGRTWRCMQDGCGKSKGKSES